MRLVCPKCGDEFREGFSTCSDCGVPLEIRGDAPEFQAEPDYKNVNPNKTPVDDSKFFEVVRIHNHAEESFIRSMFDAENVQYYVLGRHGHFPGHLPTEIIFRVLDEHFEKAQGLIKEYDRLNAEGPSFEYEFNDEDDESEENLN